MLYRIAADAVALLHLGFILFVVLGGLLVLRRPALKWLHLPAALWGVLIEFGGWICPLTRYENLFRARAGVAGYGGGFVEHYVVSLIYPAGLTRGLELVLGAAVLIINIVVYVRVFR
ncbi:MAG: DUF2784 domain-containing protein [Acidobacteriota bacterium]